MEETGTAMRRSAWHLQFHSGSQLSQLLLPPECGAKSAPSQPPRIFLGHLHQGQGRQTVLWNGSQARVDADHVKLIYSRIIHSTVYCEIGFGMSDEECSEQGTMVTQMSNLQLMNSLKPVSTRMEGRDERKMLYTTSVAGQAVAQVTVAVGVPIILVLVLWFT